MKTQLQLAALALLLSTLNSQLSTCLAQGALTPPGAPAATMRTLAQIEPRTPISSAPFTISAPGSYYLTGNLTGIASADGITIASGNVTLDLGGFALMGVPGSATAISVSGARTNITVSNGSVSGWGGSGVQAVLSASRNIVIDHMNVSACTGAGIYVQGATVSSCCVRGGGSFGINVNASEVHGCSVSSSPLTGIYSVDSTIRDCLVEGSGAYGIYVQSGTVSGCRVRTSVASGIYVDLPGCLITGNVCTGNNTLNLASYAGIYINDSNNRVENNFLHANGSLGAGILVNGTYAGNIIIKNSVAGHGANNYLVPANQILGPLITTTGTITNSNPWANFSF